MKKFLLALLVPLLLVLGLPSTAHASTQDFVINNFDADYTLSNQDPQGTLHIIEKIDLTYSDYNHGILRAIPSSYKNHSLQLRINSVTSTTGVATQYTTYKENGNTVLKIGDPDRTITGAQQYTIDYTLNNVISFYNDHDELYWDINGDQWQQKFEHVSVKVHLPEGLKSSNTACFAGAYGSTDGQCKISGDSEILAGTTAKLEPYETLTIVAGFQKGYFRAPTLADNIKDIARVAFPAIVLPVIVFIYSFRRWRKFGRDPKGRGTIVPEYGPPDSLKPIEAGTLGDFRTDNSDLTATIVDLAVNGYLKIIEMKKGRLIGKDKLSYNLELTGKDEKDLVSFESDILAGFRAAAPNNAAALAQVNKTPLVISLNDLKQQFYTTAIKTRTSVVKGMVEKGYFPTNPMKAGGRLFGLAGGLFLALFILGSLGGAMVASLVISAVIAIGFAIAMPSRTEKGVEALDKINGLKLYLKTAEKDRIKMLQSPDAPYANNHDAPKKTVELFEKLLPYAMVLGVETDWAKQFEDIYTVPPDWYSGNWTTFNVGLFMGSLHSSMASVNAVAFSAPSSSGSSGFGGGFSGGGGGGGGGGGW